MQYLNSFFTFHEEVKYGPDLNVKLMSREAAGTCSRANSSMMMKVLVVSKTFFPIFRLQRCAKLLGKFFEPFKARKIGTNVYQNISGEPN